MLQFNSETMRYQLPILPDRQFLSIFLPCPWDNRLLEFLIQRNLNNCFAYDLVPSVEVLTAALKAARRVNDYPTAVRVFEGTISPSFSSMPSCI